MSSDNTIIILNTKNEFRVGHFQAADNLWFTWIDPAASAVDSYTSREDFETLLEESESKKENVADQGLISARLFEYFYDIEPIPAGLINFGAKQKALNQAGELYDKIGYVEYGIQTLTVDKTFRDIALEASEQVKQEMLSVRNSDILSVENKALFSEELETTLKNIHDWLAVHG